MTTMSTLHKLDLDATIISGSLVGKAAPGIPRIAAPCFAPNVFSVGGMSGGPVFDETGHVIGIVSESIGNDGPDDYVTFVSLIWPVVLFEFEGVYPQGMFPTGSRPRGRRSRRNAKFRDEIGGAEFAGEFLSRNSVAKV